MYTKWIKGFLFSLKIIIPEDGGKKKQKKTTIPEYVVCLPGALQSHPYVLQPISDIHVIQRFDLPMCSIKPRQ
jgi:hypothetical protein